MTGSGSECYRLTGSVPAQLLALIFALDGGFMAAFKGLPEHSLDNREPGHHIALLISCDLGAIAGPEQGLRDIETCAQALSRLEAMPDRIVRRQVV